MAQPVNPSPILPAKVGVRDLQALDQFDRDLLNRLLTELQAHAFRINLALMSDGSEPMTGPAVLASYVKTALPSASTYARGLIYVSNETGGATVAFSDGTNWRRVQDRNVVS